MFSTCGAHKKDSVYVCFLCAFFLCFCLFPAKGQGDLGELKEGQKIPAFEVGSYKSATDDGKIRIIILFRDDQEVSEKCFRALATASQKFMPKKVVFIGIASDEPAAVQEMAKKYNITFPMLSDTERAAFDRFEAIVLPSTYIVDKQGTLVQHLTLFPNNYLQEIVAHLEWLCGEISKEEMEKKLNGTNTQRLSAKERKEIYNLNMARRLWGRGMKSIAVSSLQKVQKQYPDFLPFFIQAGSWELAEKRYDKALTIFQECNKKSPKEADPWLGMAIAYRLLGKTKEAQAALEKYDKAGGRKYRVIYEQARMTTGDKAQLELFKKVLTALQHKLAEGEAKAFYEKGQAAEKAGKSAQAILSYRQAIENVFNRELIVVPDAVEGAVKKLEESSVTKPTDKGKVKEDKPK